MTNPQKKAARTKNRQGFAPTEADAATSKVIQRELREGTPNTPQRVATIKRAKAVYARTKAGERHCEFILTMRSHYSASGRVQVCDVDGGRAFMYGVPPDILGVQQEKDGQKFLVSVLVQPLPSPGATKYHNPFK